VPGLYLVQWALSVLSALLFLSLILYCSWTHRIIIIFLIKVALKTKPTRYVGMCEIFQVEKTKVFVLGCVCVYVVLEFELRAYTLSHSTNPFL
jgi:hypothetical protein